MNIKKYKKKGGKKGGKKKYSSKKNKRAWTSDRRTHQARTENRYSHCHY